MIQVALLLALLNRIATLTESCPLQLQGTVQPGGPRGRDPYPLTVGIDATKNHAIDLGQLSFFGEGFIWLCWVQELQRFPEDSAIEVDGLSTFQNQIERWDASWQQDSPTLQQLEDSSLTTAALTSLIDTLKSSLSMESSSGSTSLKGWICQS